MDFNLPEELKMLQALVRDFVKDRLLPLERELLGRDGEPSSGKLYLPKEIESDLIRTAKEMGLWGLNLPEELGGVGLSTLGICLVQEELARTIVPFNFGYITPLLFECSEEQKEEYLKPVLEREKRAAIALLEPGEEVAPLTIKTRAEKVDDGYLLNGSKIALSAIGEGDFALVFATTDPEAGVREGVTCFLVDYGTPGFSVLEDGEIRWQTYFQKPLLLLFKDCLVKREKILGKEGRAFSLGSNWLLRERIIRGARCVGAASRLLEASVEYAKNWEKFGKPVASSLSAQGALADMATDIKAARLMVYSAACKADEGEKMVEEVAMVKVFTSQMLSRCADRAVQIHGGPIPAQELPLERLCQNALVTSAAERALELQKAIITSDLLKRLG